MACGLYLFVISVTGFGLDPPFAGWLMDSVFTGEYAASKALITIIISRGIIATVSFVLAIKSYGSDQMKDSG